MLADVRANGGGQLQILGADGTTPRITLGAGGGIAGNPADPALNVGMQVFNIQEQQILRAGVLDLVGPGFQLVDAAGTVRYRASLDGDGNPSVRIFDEKGAVIWAAP